jgi:predicted nuclease with TOPRIM domain
MDHATNPTNATDGAANGAAGGDIRALEARVDRLERQLAVMVKRFSERLNAHERRLDRVDEPAERSWLRPDQPDR